MHGSKIALLVLAASAAVPVFSAPVSSVVNLNLTTTDGRLVCRDDGHIKVIPKHRQINGDPVSSLNIELNTADGTLVCHGGDIGHIPENEKTFNALSSRSDGNSNPTLGDYMALASMLPRDADSVETQARGLLDVLKRFLRPSTAQAGSAGGVTPDPLAARDNVDDFVAAVMSHRDLNPGQEMQSVARDSLDDYLALLNSRDLGPEAEIQARSKFLDGLMKAVEMIIPRDVTDDQMATRDAPGMTPRQVIKLAMLMGRSLDDLE